jgi:hypothetical protein
VNHEPARWSRTARPLSSSATLAPPQQLHLASQGYPVRIRRALLAGGLALALAAGATLAASLTGGSTVPTSGQSDAVVTQPVSVGS